MLILIAAAIGASGAAVGQTGTAPQTPAVQTAAAQRTFDVASIRPSPPPDIPKMMANLQAGIRPDSVHIDASRATFTYYSLKQLIAYAYKLRVYEINGPDWLLTDRFDIVATMPEGASKNDVPAMLRPLLEDRFHLAAHTETQDQPVLALIAAKGGPKLQPATVPATPFDETAPLKAGESIVDSPTGPIRLTKNPDGSTTYNMGTRGSFSLRFDGPTLSMHMAATNLSMPGFAIMMTTLGGGEGRQVVDQTGLTGNYQADVDFSLTDLMSSLRDQGIQIPNGPAGPPGGGGYDPDSGPTVSAALAKIGLKLEKGRANVERLVVDHVDKDPTAN